MVSFPGIRPCPLGGGFPGGLVQFPRRKGCCLDHSILCFPQDHSNGNHTYESDEDSLGSCGRVMLPEEPCHGCVLPVSGLCVCPLPHITAACPGASHIS